MTLASRALSPRSRAAAPAMLLVLAVLHAVARAEFIEDTAASAETSTFHMLFGAQRMDDGELRLLSSDPPKAPWLDPLAMDFAGHSIALQRLAETLADSVRIYVHQVPRCIGEEALESFGGLPSGSAVDVPGGLDFGWSKALQLHAQHAAAVHSAIMSSGYLTSDPRRATMFYIPAFPGLLVERWIDTGDPAALNCIASLWNALPEHIFLRNGGYDHFMVAGTCHPYSICGAMECDVTSYHPFAGNVIVLAGGVRERGSLDVAFDDAAMYRNLRTISVPFPVALDCERLRALAAPAAPRRPIAVTFVGSANSRVRSHFAALAADPRWHYAGDARVVLRLLPDTEAGENARRAALEPEGSTSRGAGIETYAQTEFCLALPGHVYELGRRGWDAMARGCILVVVEAKPLHVTVPFAWQVPWEDFTVFTSADSSEEAAEVIHALVRATETEEGRGRIAARRAALLRHAPSLFLPPFARCPEGSASAVDGIVQDLAVRQAALASLRTLRPAGWPAIRGGALRV